MGIGKKRSASLVAATLIGALLFAPITFAAVSNPAQNLVPVPNFNATCIWQGGAVVQGYCTYNPTTGVWRFATSAREQAALEAINNARATEGIGALVLPANWDALNPDEQQFVLVNLERIARGLPPLVGMSASLDALAMEGATADADPTPRGSWAAYATGSNWAGEGQVAPAMFAYMYMDGWGGSSADTPNLACTGPTSSGCWGHRDNILGDYGSAGLMGAADLANSSAQIFVAYDGPPVPLSYTWTAALEAGAGGTPLQADPGVGLPFSDLTQALWASIPVAALAHAGITLGTGPDTFSPDAPLTLEQWVTLLGRTMNWPAAAPDSVAPSGTDWWAASAMAVAEQRGILPSGVSPTADIDRVQATSILVAAMSLPAAGAGAPFSDIGALPAAQQRAIAAAWSAGLIDGMGNGVFDPNGGLNRAQAATLLLRAALYELRAGTLTSLGGQPASATQLPGDLFQYTIAGEQLLVSANGTPLALYSGPTWGPDAVLAFAEGQYWTGQAVWQAASGSWPTGATQYGSAVLRLWPAGQQVGPALFQSTVQLANFGGGDTQYLLPGSAQWESGAPALLSNVTMVADMALR